MLFIYDYVQFEHGGSFLYLLFLNSRDSKQEKGGMQACTAYVRKDCLRLFFFCWLCRLCLLESSSDGLLKVGLDIIDVLDTNRDSVEREKKESKVNKKSFV